MRAVVLLPLLVIVIVFIDVAEARHDPSTIYKRPRDASSVDADESGDDSDDSGSSASSGSFSGSSSTVEDTKSRHHHHRRHHHHHRRRRRHHPRQHHRHNHFRHHQHRHRRHRTQTKNSTTKVESTTTVTTTTTLDEFPTIGPNWSIEYLCNQAGVVPAENSKADPDGEENSENYYSSSADSSGAVDDASEEKSANRDFPKNCPQNSSSKAPPQKFRDIVMENGTPVTTTLPPRRRPNRRVTVVRLKEWERESEFFDALMTGSHRNISSIATTAVTATTREATDFSTIASTTTTTPQITTTTPQTTTTTTASLSSRLPIVTLPAHLLVTRKGPRRKKQSHKHDDADEEIDGKGEGKQKAKDEEQLRDVDPDNSIVQTANSTNGTASAHRTYWDLYHAGLAFRNRDLDKDDDTTEDAELRRPFAEPPPLPDLPDECSPDSPVNSCACRAPKGSASFFLGKDLLLDARDGVIHPDSRECSCRSGTMYAYRAIGVGHDFDELADTKDLSVGRFYCKNSSMLCVETSSGQKYRGEADAPVALQPVPFCHANGKCRIYMVLTPLSSYIGAENVDDKEFRHRLTMVDSFVSESPADQSIITPDTYARLGFGQFNYKSIIGADCGGCEQPIEFCDPAIKLEHARARHFRKF